MKLRRTRLLFAGAAALLLAAAPAGWLAWLGPPPLGKELEVSNQVVDRNGRLLRAYTTEIGRWRLPTTLDAIDGKFLDALLAYEDKRFYSHHGVDPWALARATLQLVRNRHIVSGGSTLTMQVARLLEPRHERSVPTKLREIARALEIEAKLSKAEVLTLYLDLAPYGGNLEGIRSASLSYFGHEPSRLSLSEIALLVALPQSPELRRPDRSVEVARQARNRVLDRIAAAGLARPDEVEQAKHEPVPAARQPMPMLSPHAADEAVAAAPLQRLHRLTIDAVLQKKLEELVHDRAIELGPELSVGMVVVDVPTGEVLARVASVDYFDERRAGQVDITAALRSPGSTLKPFIYGMAFEDGLIHPETLIEDRPVRYGGYAPKNFDLTFQGTVTVRHALQLSLNVPAVAVLDAVGPGRLATRLKEAGAVLVLPKGDAPGLAMGLGGIGISLADLTKLYADLARGGAALALSERRDETAASARPAQLLDPIAAWYVGNILIGTPPPANAVGGRIAFKTGTSYGYRDAWAVGFDGRRAVGVWVGRPDGAPVPGIAGRTAAAPILFDAFFRMDRPFAPLPAAPKGALIAATGKLPLPLQRFTPGLQLVQGGAPPRIMFPPDGARLDVGSGAGSPVALKVTGGVAPLTVLVNGVPAASAGAKRSVFWEPDGPGFTRLTVMDARGVVDSVVVFVQPESKPKAPQIKTPQPE
jgi:penicillin-binding protein 1C